MKSFYLIAAVALLSLVQLSAGLGIDLGLISGDINFLGLGASDKQYAIPDALYTAGFMSTNTGLCVRVTQVVAAKKQTYGILVITTGFDIEVTFTAVVIASQGWQNIQCTSVVGHTKPAPFIRSYYCNAVVPAYNSGLKRK